MINLQDIVYKTCEREQTERGRRKVLRGESGRDSGSCMKCWLQWMCDGSAPTRGYM